MPLPRDTTLLIAPDATELRAALLSHGFQAINWPVVNVVRLESTPVLDDAIENLYGYDWLIFVNDYAVDFFLERLREHGQDVSDLDSQRVCAIGDQTAAALEQTWVHVDVIVARSASQIVLDEFATYVGGRDVLRRLNFLVPQAAIGRDYLKGELEEAGARVDVVAVYQTVADADTTRLIAIQTMLQTGSVDAVVFSQLSDIENIATLFDTWDIGKLLKNTVVITNRDPGPQAVKLLGDARRSAISDMSGATLVAALARTLA